METIKNCRKCGRPGRIKDTFKKFRRGWVGCPVCKIYFHWVYTPADAVKKWNEWNQAQNGRKENGGPSGRPAPTRETEVRS